MATLPVVTNRFTLDAFKNGKQRIVHGYLIGESAERTMEISLMCGSQPFELPLANVTAAMYVKRPSDTDPSINACTIDGENNKIIYEVQDSDIAEAGIVDMQLKIFDNEKILISPLFGLDVWGSIVDDSTASESPSYTALTAALAEAQAARDSSLTSITIDDATLIITFTYADGTTIENSALHDALGEFTGESLVSEGWAKGTQNGVPVEEGSPYYHDNSKFHSDTAKGYAESIEGSVEAASGYASEASGYADAAEGFKDQASGYADTAEGYVGDAHDEVVAAQAQATLAESYAKGGTGTRTGEDTDNAKHYKDRCEQIAASLEGGFIPMGTISFAQLPTENIGNGWMYNISDAFTSDSRFEDGGGKNYAAGTNVYYTAQGKWDCMAGEYAAANTKYDNTTSGYDATNVQNAIDEVITKKAAKVSGATNGNFAGLDASGNLTDSGKKASDFQTALTLTSQTATGNPLSFTTDSAQVSQGTVITLEPIQSGSGDPSPSNVRAISGYDEIELAVPRGKNLIDQSKAKLITLSDGQTQRIGLYAVFHGTYTISATLTGTLYIRYQRTNDFRDVSLSSSSPSGTYEINGSIWLWVSNSATEFNDVVSNLQIELGSTATTYEPYNPITDISIQLDSTIYGGTLDVESGELVVDKGIKILDGSGSWSGDLTGGFYTALHNMKKLSSYTDKIFCECLKTVSTQSTVKNTDKSISGFNDSGSSFPNQNWLYLRNTDWTSSSAINTYFTSNPTKVVYPLATPLSYHLTPHQVKLLQGANVVTSNGTSISLTYRKGDIAKLSDLVEIADSVNELSDLVDGKVDNTILGATVERGTTASQAYSANDLFVKDGKLCKASTSIASGATLTKNTNYVETSLSALITTLLNA